MELEVEYEFSIIGIITTLEDYQLAYNLNKYLGTSFKRERNDIDVQGKSENELSYFSHFFYSNEEEMEEWHLINNRYNTEEEFSERVDSVSQNLFYNNDQVMQLTRYFLPEKKKANYILRLDLMNTNLIDKLVSKIHAIPSVTTAFSIKYDTLHSKQNLIF